MPATESNREREKALFAAAYSATRQLLRKRIEEDETDLDRTCKATKEIVSNFVDFLEAIPLSPVSP